MNLNNQDSVIENAIELGGTTFVEDTVKNCVGTSQKSVEDNSGEPGFDANIDTDESHFDMDVDVDIGGSDKDNRVVDDIKRRPDFDGNGPCELEGITQAENMHAPAASVLMDDLNFNLVNPIDQSNPSGCEAIVTYKYTKISDDGPEQCVEVPEEKDGSSVPVNEQRRATLRSQQQSKHERLSRRQSLAASGTSCKAGLRKSTRKRTRPLEYWKGERMVYGRVHDNKSNPSGCEAIVTNKYTKISDDGPELCLEVSEEKDGSSVPVNEQRRAKLLSQEQSKHERLSRRQSLAASGTSCNAGLRKSTRIRTRPLEYWKGERMVYGRVHDSLATVIGIKCISPGSDGKPTMKVKSYVSDEYKELLELASLH
ncbi:PREDICTED: uncharacterized protein LOC109344648 [Lupinus angustifolius]|uniref:uncharacterized protein LOC109344648 n=1 Tax=Lupinus angustifolius TaxID=3871 RepID=UPI00092F3C05|nr:PREDICTED: uncharacterized protein LOC109344648 [Lupinus angustifolius]